MLRCRQRVQHTLIFGFFDSRFANRTSAAASRGEDDVTGAADRRGQRMLLREVSWHDLDARCQYLACSCWIAREHANGSALLVEKARDEQASTARPANDEYWSRALYHHPY